MNKEILMVAEAVSNEKGVSEDIIFEAIELAHAARVGDEDRTGIADGDARRAGELVLAVGGERLELHHIAALEVPWVETLSVLGQQLSTIDRPLVVHIHHHPLRIGCGHRSLQGGFGGWSPFHDSLGYFPHERGLFHEATGAAGF